MNFVCEQQILEGALKNYQVLYMPQISMMQPPGAQVIGRVVDGDPAVITNKSGHLGAKNWNTLAMLMRKM